MKLLVLCVFITLGVNDLLGQSQRIGVPAIEHFSKVDYDAGTQNWMIDQGVSSLLYIANNKIKAE